MKLGKWSTTAGNNNNTPPDGWPEGQAPSTVNDCGREMMASIKTFVNELPYIDYANTPSYLSSTTFSLGTADTNTFKVGRRIKAFDASTLYGTIISVSATYVNVRLDSGAFTSSLSSVAVSVLNEGNHSLPKVALRRKNFIFNPFLDFWQRSATFVFNSIVSGGWTADMFYYKQSAGGEVKVTRAERSADTGNVPTIEQCGMLLNNSMKFEVTSADASLAAGEYAHFEYRMEGYDWRQLAGKGTNLGFWVKTNATGVYCCALRSTSYSASCVMPYTLTAADTWTRISLPYLANPIDTANWNYKNGTGLRITFTLASGSTYQGGEGSWTSVNIIANNSQANFLANVGNTFHICPIQYEEGQQFTDLEAIDIRETQADVERYCEKSYPLDIGPGTQSATAGASGTIIANSAGNMLTTGMHINFSVPKANTPTVTLYSPASGISGRSYNPIMGADYLATTDAAVSTKGFSWYSSCTASTTIRFLTHWFAESPLE